jgi:hypothetical protein
MKTKFNSALEVIHTFAQRAQKEGRSSNVFFYNDKIYSYGYHYLLAEFIVINNETCILINDKGYSHTTSKHISEIRQATRQYKQYFTSNVCLYDVRQIILSNYAKLLKANKPEIYIHTIISKFESLVNYPLFTTNNKKSVEFKEIKKIYDSINNPDALFKAKETVKKLAQKKKIDDANKLKLSLKKFYNYETDYLRNSEDYIRISKDKLFVESSQSVKVPINDAKLLYSMIQAKKDIKGYNIDGYTVISINGTLKIGCHNINIESVNKVGKELINL